MKALCSAFFFSALPAISLAFGRKMYYFTKANSDYFFPGVTPLFKGGRGG
jgi:hypothetical protein